MQNKNFDEILAVFQAQRDELICRLVSFVASDTLLFLPQNIKAGEEVKKVNQLLDCHFVRTEGIEVLSENISQNPKLKAYLDNCSVIKQAYVYLVATELRSVLTAILLAEKQIDCEEAFNLAFSEELIQQKKWGVMPEVEDRQRSIRMKLKDLERWFDERSLS